MEKPCIIPISQEQIRSIQKLQALDHKPTEPVAQLENVKVYQLENGTYEIELQETTRFVIKDYATPEMDLYFEHYQKCEQCRLGNCRFRLPITATLVSKPGPELSKSTLTLNFVDKQYCGLSNKERKVQHAWKE